MVALGSASVDSSKIAIALASGCIRFSNDVPADASNDASDDAPADTVILPETGKTADAADASLDADVDAARDALADAPSDAVADAPPPPICQRFDPNIRFAVAGDLVTALLQAARSGVDSILYLL